MAIDALPKEKSKPKVSISDFRFLIHGWPKLGKSTLASMFPDVLFLCTEQGVAALSVYKIDIHNWDDLVQAIELLKKGEHSFRTVVLDTVELAYRYLTQKVATENRVKHISKMDYGAGWDECNKRFHSMLETLYGMGLGVILCSHTRTVKEVQGGMAFNRRVPNLSASPREVVAGWVDLIIYLDVMEEVDENQKVISRKRIAVCQPRPEVEAGGRLSHMPETIELPSPRKGFQNLQAAFNDAVKQLLVDYDLTDKYNLEGD